MAQFVGTVQDYHHFIGPRIRNVVNQTAAPARKHHGGTCENCGQHAELQSAHVHGRERRALIEAVLAEYTRIDGWVDCDIEEVERRVIEAHLPIEATFKFLCPSCHRTYDAGTRERTSGRRRASPTREEADSEFKKLGRVELWAVRPRQSNHQIIRAFLELEHGGGVYLSALREYCERELDMSGFKGKYAAMKTDAGNSYGKVFFDDGDVVRMWPPVRREVERYF